MCFTFLILNVSWHLSTTDVLEFGLHLVAFVFLGSGYLGLLGGVTLLSYAIAPNNGDSTPRMPHLHITKKKRGMVVGRAPCSAIVNHGMFGRPTSNDVAEVHRDPSTIVYDFAKCFYVENARVKGRALSTQGEPS